jgi:tetratricopeptide (TPR) repeat protein
LLAYHYRQAEDAARERRYVAMLGEQLFNTSAFREAMTCFERSLSLTPDGPAHQAQRARLTAWLARSYALLGEPGQAQRLYQESLALAEAAEDYAGAAGACYELGSLAYRRTAHAEALSYLERSLTLYRVAHDRAGEGRVLDRLGGLYIELGEEAKALEFYQQAIALGRSGGQRRTQHTHECVATPQTVAGC